MNRFGKLVHYELFRFRKIYASLLALTFLSQLVGVYLFARKYMADAHNRMLWESLSAAEYAVKYGIVAFSRYSGSSLWFLGPIALCAAALLLYVFLIWYRDWFGKNMFIYRLLMLPTSRTNLFLARISAILLWVWGLVAFQLLILPLQNALFNALIPSDFRESAAVIDIVMSHPLLKILIPRTFTEFALYYLAGLAAVIVVFTAILIERSYRFKGIAGGIVYCALAAAVFVAPIFIAETWFAGYLYPTEEVVIEIVVGLLIGCASLWLSFFLLRKKVTV
jgi:hypothetical protein